MEWLARAPAVREAACSPGPVLVRHSVRRSAVESPSAHAAHCDRKPAGTSATTMFPSLRTPEGIARAIRAVAINPPWQRVPAQRAAQQATSKRAADKSTRAPGARRVGLRGIDPHATARGAAPGAPDVRGGSPLLRRQGERDPRLLAVRGVCGAGSPCVDVRVPVGTLRVQEVHERAWLHARLPHREDQP